MRFSLHVLAGTLYEETLSQIFAPHFLMDKIMHLVRSPFHEALPEEERIYEPLWQSTSSVHGM
ncbi:hypothetical protein F9K88_13015 [Brucella intermedia]|uniref:Uncharacterized protein n=3 Tax=Brucella intermedia TaxID=94625 RepID=U4V2D2_9HYPH|nr:Hypothetical protein OINT_2001570 [Brucella intermedia LMG 3301]ELT50408.1 hypothetical protein D584_03758 [Brucella intermedia M86]ERM00155.1 hypothetical protein Q644_06405 [Brucella intermedia 229E]KAB2668621.1 hypothetical protein F9K77_20180 [Ochrobactrum sp. LMG 5442]KAB2710129.1 hypothetical protein F9K88_13015 [Brucella intermedia]PJT24971.1 hypothetical protein CN884_08700 [Ochrobactrum sp. 30A/1000/2015]PJT40421.1 hypothetical protein CN883_02685 [Ochrobactrum sp. 27A/999/2015]P